MRKRSAIAASFGDISLTEIPGTDVSIGENSPRMFAGASGFGSHVSCCGGPPVRNSRTHRFARPNVESETAVAATVRDGNNGSADNPATDSHVRREIAGKGGKR